MRLRYSAISLVGESEHERTGTDAHVDTLLNDTVMEVMKRENIVPRAGIEPNLLYSGPVC